MVATDKVFAGSIPEIYDRFLVPLIFEPYAIDLAAMLSKATPEKVLEVAAGTGVLTRALAARLSTTTRLVATDLNPPMVAYARRGSLMTGSNGNRLTVWRCRSRTEASTRWRVSSA